MDPISRDPIEPPSGSNDDAVDLTPDADGIIQIEEPHDIERIANRLLTEDVSSTVNGVGLHGDISSHRGTVYELLQEGFHVHLYLGAEINIIHMMGIYVYITVHKGAKLEQLTYGKVTVDGGVIDGVVGRSAVLLEQGRLVNVTEGDIEVRLTGKARIDLTAGIEVTNEGAEIQTADKSLGIHGDIDSLDFKIFDGYNTQLFQDDLA